MDMTNDATPEHPKLPAIKRGPTTVAGRNAVALNSLRHGLYSDAIVIPHLETEHDWARFFESAIARINPDGAIEEALAVTVAELLWRLRRIPRAERDFVSEAHKEALVKERSRAKSRANDESNYEYAKEKMPFYAGMFAPNPDKPPTPQPIRPRVLPPDNALQALIRYEAHLYRQLYHALHELEALQARRTGEPVNVARVDLHGLPAE